MCFSCENTVWMLKAEAKSAECTADKMKKLKSWKSWKVEHIDSWTVSVGEHGA